MLQITIFDTKIEYFLLRKNLPIWDPVSLSLNPNLPIWVQENITYDFDQSYVFLQMQIRFQIIEGKLEKKKNWPVITITQ